MSTNNDKRPSIDSTKFSLSKLFTEIRNNIRSLRQGLLLASISSLILGFIVWIFFRDLSTIGLWIMLAGTILSILIAIISINNIFTFIFGRRGRYGINTSIIFITSLALVILLNSLLFWLSGRPDSPDWLRIDTTATKQFILEDQAIKVIGNLNEDVKINVFMATNTPSKAAAWRSTEDLLLEFKRRSKKVNFDYEKIDPELDPNSPAKYGVNSFPSIVVEAIDSRRTQVIPGRNTNISESVFTEQDIITGLLIVNQLKQKEVIFLTGHGERDITDFDGNSSGMGLVYSDLLAQNYKVMSATSQELAILLSENSIPAVLVIAGAVSNISVQESAIISEYLWKGGTLLLMIEPEITPDGIKTFLYKYGIGVGEGTIFDMASFVAPKPNYLQMGSKRTSILNLCMAMANDLGGKVFIESG